MLKKIERELMFTQYEHKARLSLQKDTSKMVLKNVYKQFYDIPNDLKVRKADSTMRAVVDSSETLRKVTELQEKGMHPSLIFFSKELYENQISKCM